MFDSEFVQTLLERIGSSSATIVLDKSGVCVFVSTTINSVLGLPYTDLLGKNFVDTVKLVSLDGYLILPEKHPCC